jgi:hypothetical protein
VSKGLRTAALIVGVVALAATGVGALASAGVLGATASAAAAGSAAALASATGGFISAAATVASIATAAAAGLSVAAQLTARPPLLGGSATRFKADKDAGLPYVIGRTATGGNIIYRRTHNTAGYSLPDLQTFVVALSCAGPVQAIESFAADRVPVAFSSGAAIGTYATWMFQTQQLGASPESAALRVTPGGTLPPGWTTAAKMSGLAAAMWTLRYDQKGKFYAQGVPVPRWVLQGVAVYDPRLDSTYPGGSGACRSNDETTFVYSENPYLHGLTFALGRYQNGKRVIGIGAPIAGIDVRAYVEGANVADANGWKVGGVITSADNKWAALKVMLQAGGGKPMHLGAMLSCTVQTPRVALATVTTDDLIGEVKVTATTSRRDRFNSVVPRYRSEAHDWEVIPAAPVTVAAHVTTDGGLRSREITYSLVQDLDQAATLARYDIEDAREFGPIVLPLKLRWLGYRPGDCIRVALPEVGLNGQDIIIGNREIDAAGLGVTLTARSETFAKHAFALGQTGVAPPTASTSTPPVPPQPGAVAWSLSGAGLVSGATVTPALIITGAAASVPIDAVVIEYRLWVSGQAAEVGWIGNGAYLPNVERVEITAVLPSTAYEIAVSYRLGPFTGARRIIGPVTTTAAGLAWSGVSGSGRPADNADVTAANTAAAIAGQGALATQNVADWGSQVGGGGKPANNADVTGANIAAGISGQGALATQNTVDYATQITGLPSAVGQITVGFGQQIRHYLGTGQSVSLDGGFGATGATSIGGIRQATLLADGTVFATGADWYADSFEPGAGTVSGTFTNSGAGKLVSFTVAYAGSAVVPDYDQCFLRG